MCGIAGIVKFDGRETVQEERLNAMGDILAHRGPDGAGIKIRGRAGLAHRRLSIIDISGGHQPMRGHGTDNWITYNGEIYNYRELRTQLQQMGCCFETNSDTEVILRAYEVYGDDCVTKLRGMFAFAIWDGGRDRLFMARDRLGVKPLYYAVDDDELLFASEIKSILEARGGRREFNRDILPEFLASRYVAGEETFYQGINKLLPAHVMSWSPREGVRQHRYWQLPVAEEDTGMSRRQYTEQVSEALDDAVRCHLVSDVPVGLFLSGGIDSTALAALMAPKTREPIRTFSVGFGETAANELDYAQLAADAVGARHRKVMVSPGEFFAALPYLIWHEDEPIAFSSSVPLHAVSRLAQDHVKVVLTGEGADELFIGYDYRYRVTLWNQRFGDVYEKCLPDGIRNSVAGMVPALPGGMRRYAERTFLAMESDPRHLFCENFAVFRAQDRRDLLRDRDLLSARDPFSEILRHYREGGEEALQCMSHADMNTYLTELLMKQDQMSMSASIESRVPYLDHKLVEQVAAIPARYKLRGLQTKAILRDAVRDIIPKSILNRKKMGFPVPVSGWLRGRYWPLVEDFILGRRAMSRGLFKPDQLKKLAMEHRSGKVDHGERLWLLLNLEIWQRIFIDGEAPSAIYQDNQRPVRDAVQGLYSPAAAAMV